MGLSIHFTLGATVGTKDLLYHRGHPTSRSRLPHSVGLGRVDMNPKRTNSTMPAASCKPVSSDLTAWESMA